MSLGAMNPLEYKNRLGWAVWLVQKISEHQNRKGNNMKNDNLNMSENKSEFKKQNMKQNMKQNKDQIVNQNEDQNRKQNKHDFKNVCNVEKNIVGKNIEEKIKGKTGKTLKITKGNEKVNETTKEDACEKANKITKENACEIANKKAKNTTKENACVIASEVTSKIENENANVSKNQDEKLGIDSDVSLMETIPQFPIRVGILYSNFTNGLLKSDVPNAFEDIFINHKNLNGAPWGMKVVCEVIDAPKDYEMRGRQYYFDELSGRGMAKGRIIEVIGDPVSNDVTMQGILIAHGLSSKFPIKVIEAAEKLPPEISESEIYEEIINGRIDRRNEQIITIDGEDAKDLDDAISVSKTQDNHYLLGVHIADVTHYVIENDAIDKEAGKRGTSVYLADRVIPMLPQVLSNGLCSLHPGKPKLALSLIMEFTNDGEMISSEITESIIQSNERFTYDEVFRMLGESSEIIERLESFRPMLSTALELTRMLRKNRFLNGSINFEFPETKVKLDSDMNVLDVYAAPVTFANELIEECMLACNEAIAKKFAILKAPFIYRIHEQPDAEKIERFQKVAKLFGEKIHFSASLKSQEIHHAIGQILDKPYGNTLMQLLLRSMAKARYSNQCLGHFGLSFDYYCHFTSPIRRYPDLFIHRVIKEYLHKKTFPVRWVKTSASFSDLNSDSERNAMQAERESVNFKTAQFMERHIGEKFEGKVTGMFRSGVFIQLENTIEGMAPFRTMDAYYEFDEDQMVARSDIGYYVIRIGDSVRVKVVQADRIARRIEFFLDESSLKQERVPSKTRKNQQNNKFNKNKIGNANPQSKFGPPNTSKPNSFGKGKGKNKNKGKPKSKK